MTHLLNATADRRATTSRRTTTSTAIAVPDTAPRAGAAKPPMRTMLVASCGWPVDAAPPARRRAARR